MSAVLWFTDCRLEEIGTLATKEYTLEKGLEKMKSEWQDLTFTFVPYRDSVSTSTVVLSPIHAADTDATQLGQLSS